MFEQLFTPLKQLKAAKKKILVTFPLGTPHQRLQNKPMDEKQLLRYIEGDRGSLEMSKFVPV